MDDKLVALDLSRFTNSDRKKVAAIGDRLRLMRRWFRHEIVRTDEGEEAQIYSGDRGPSRYAHYRIVRGRNGAYALYGRDPSRHIAEARTIDRVIDAIPQDFFYAAPAPRR